MKSKSLYDLVDIPVHKTGVTLGRARFDLMNQSCHYLFESRSERHETLGLLDLEGAMVVECCADGTAYPASAEVVESPRTMEELLGWLDGLLEDGSSTVVLRTLLIDNISVFYWGLRVLNQTNHKDAGYRDFSAARYYVGLGRRLEKIRSKYRCNVIVTSWDVNFDRGYNSRWKAPTETKLDTFSYLPPAYLLCFDYIFHVGREGHRYFNKSQKSWTTVGKG